jgi:histone H3/H4
MSHLTSAIEIMSEELRLLREAANDDAGANEISEHLAMLDTSVNALPDKLADRAQTIADTAARKTLSDMPC